RRPPLTTAAQRRIFTTRSSRPSCRLSRSRSRAMCKPAPVRASKPTGCNPGAWELELQAPLAGRVGQRLDAAMISVMSAVEGRLADTLLLGHFGELLAHGDGRLDV